MRHVRSFFLLLLAALLIRCWQFGNPVLNNDEQFYLLVGDRMLHGGALPYVDIWDRKPVGLFLIYAAIRLLGGEGVVQYQLVATLFAAATALVVTCLAGRVARPRGALAAGLVYLLTLGVFGGAGGQSPVFYNLFVAGAALLVVRAGERPGPGFAPGCGAMALVGIALQVKYSAVFEGGFLGLALIVLAWRSGERPARIAVMAAGWIALALAPTAAAWGWYAAAGHGGAFAYANFRSIFDRDAAPLAVTAGRLAGMAVQLSPLAAAAIVGMRGRRDPAGRLLAGWALAAVAGVLLFGGYFDHYALPVLVPLAVCAAPVLERTRAALPIGALALALSAVAQLKARAHYGSGAEQHRIATAVGQHPAGCLFVFDAELALYRMTHSCLPSRWIFPSHLINADEARAAGVDQGAEIARILAARPSFVVATEPPDSKLNPASLAALRQGLAGRYVRVLTVPVGARRRVVYRRSDPR